MSAALQLRPVPATDVAFIVDTLRQAAACYLRDAIDARVKQGPREEFREALRQHAEALRIAGDLEAGAPLPLFLRRQAD